MSLNLGTTRRHVNLGSVIVPADPQRPILPVLHIVVRCYQLTMLTYAAVRHYMPDFVCTDDASARPVQLLYMYATFCCVLDVGM